MKVCGTCGDEKPASAFYAHARKGLQSSCKVCKAEYNRRHYRANASRYKASAARNRSLDGRLRSQYGINEEQHRKFLEAQDGSCAICLATFEGRRACVDHCHKSGRVRGLLCAKCNSAIGFLSDSTDALKRAIEYLGR